MENNLLLLPAPKPTISKKLLILDALLVGTIITLVFSLSITHQNKKEVYVPPKVFTALSLQAKAVYVYDVSTSKIIFQKNQDAELPLASLTKLMMALTATELFPENSKIIVKKEFLQDDGFAQFQLDEKWRLKDLLDFSLLVSSNDGARSIAGTFGRGQFIQKMNDEAKKLGLSMRFNNESGLDEGNVSGGYGTAEDVSKLLTYIVRYKPQLLEATRYKVTTIDSLNTSHIAKNTDEIVSQIPGIIASKTGFTNLAGGNLAVAFDSSIGHPIVVVVLGSTQKGRFDDMSALVRASLEYGRE